MGHDLSAGAGEPATLQRSRDFYPLAGPQIKVLWAGKMWKRGGNASGVARGSVSDRVRFVEGRRGVLLVKNKYERKQIDQGGLTSMQVRKVLVNSLGGSGAKIVG